MSKTEPSVISLLKSHPAGMNVFEIAEGLRVDITQAQKNLRELQEKRIIISGLQKREPSATLYERLYFCSPRFE